MTTKTIYSSLSASYTLPTSPLSGSYLESSFLKSSKSSSIFEKLENGTYRDNILTANDAFTPATTESTTTNNINLENVALKTPMYWTPEVLSINPKVKYQIEKTFEDFKFSGDERILNKLERQSFQNRGKLQKLLKIAIRDYNKYLILAKEQEWLELNTEDKSTIPNKLNGEYIYMKLQIREIQIIKYELLCKMFDYYHDVLFDCYQRYEDAYNTEGEKRKLGEELTALFNQFYDLLLQIEYLEREENKMIYLLQNKKLIKIEQDGYLKYYWEKVRNLVRLY